MSKETDRRQPLEQAAASVSLVAVVACVLASDALALARQSPAEPSVGERELSARVEAIAERIRSGQPAFVRELPPEAKIAQWPNR
jgi:hypothetical protein